MSLLELSNLSNFRFDVKLDVGLGHVRIGSPVVGTTITGRIHTNTINHDNSNAQCEFEQRTLFFIKLYCFLTYDGCTPHETCAFRGAFRRVRFSAESAVVQMTDCSYVQQRSMQHSNRYLPHGMHNRKRSSQQ